MQNQTSACTHCACHNPMWNILKEDLFNPAHLAKATSGLKLFTEPEGESLVISGGTIRPLIDGNMDKVEAIGIHKGKVLVTGSLESVKAFMKSNGIEFKEKQLLETHTLLPGLIEPHVHIVPTALLLGWMDLGPFDGQVLRPGYDVAWLTETIAAQVRHHELKYLTGSWILGKGVDPALMPFTVNKTPGQLNELVTFDCDSLDKMVKHIPLLMESASMHTVYVNTKALRIIYEKNKEKLDETYKIKHFDEYKAITKGQLQEMDMTYAFRSIPVPQLIEMVMESFKYITRIFETANSRGVTFMYDAGMIEAFKVLLEAYLLFHHKKVRIGAADLRTVDDGGSLNNYEPVAEYKDIYYGHVKLVSDGSNQGLTGYQSDPYCCAPPDNTGLFDFTDQGDPKPKTIPQVYSSLVNTVSVQKGWPLMIHANGDLAITFALNAYSSVITNDTTKRNRIEHCSILTPDHIAEMKRLGISPSFLIGHVGYWGYAFREAIFEDKAEKLDLCKSALDAGMKITLHSDYEVSPLGPLRMMEQSITRIMEGAPGNPSDNVLNPAERLTPEQALLAVTCDAAWQCYADKWVGSLAPGYFADFVILEQDPLTLNDYYMNLRNIPVSETWKGGVKVYSKSIL